ncbi:MAG: hypothetical protein V1776_04750 [Candidatus Diapherotrites archaeon]
MSKEKKGGWQANVEFFDNYVIKTPKTDYEIRKKISKYLKPKGKLHTLDKRVEEMKKGWKEGIRILNKKKIPTRMLGYIEFLEHGKIRQKKVITLEDSWNEAADNGNVKEMKKIVNKAINFIIELWKYGIHEKTGKIGYEFGLMKNKIILIDFGEISENKKIPQKQILKKYWKKPLERHSRKEVLNYFNKMADKKLTIQTLNKNWNKKREK